MNILKSVGLVVAGVAVGVGATYKYFKTKYEGYANEEIESVKMMVKNRDLKASMSTVPEKAVDEVAQKDSVDDTPIEDMPTPKLSPEDQIEQDKLTKGINASIARRTKKPPYTQPVRTMYNKIAKTYNPDQQTPLRQDELDEEQGEFEEETDYSSAQVDVLKTADRPYVISARQFVDENQDYEKITLNYFDKDDVLMDEDREQIDMVEDVIGEGSLSKFGSKGGPSNLVYVRNEKLEIDYEVIKQHLSYAVDEMGFRD